MIIQSLKKAQKTNSKFFGIHLRFKADFHYSREILANASWDSKWLKSNKWVSGYILASKKTIQTFSPTVWEIETIHKIKDFKKVVGHELTHIYTRYFYDANLPTFFWEGLACLVNDQLCDEQLRKSLQTHKPLRFKKNLNYIEKANPNDETGRMYYSQSVSMMNWLLNKKGKQKILSFIKDKETDITKRFKKHFTLTPTSFAKQWYVDFKKQK